jgi:hypothetical protein
MIKIDWIKAKFTTSCCLPVYYATDGEVTHIILDRGSRAEWLFVEDDTYTPQNASEADVMEMVTHHCDSIPWHATETFHNVADAITAAVLWEVDGAKPFGRAKRAAERLSGE